MNRTVAYPCFLLICGIAFLASSPAVLAQGSEPNLSYAYPAGGQAGTSLRISVAGQYLRGADSVIVSGKGVRAAVLAYQGSGGPLTKVQEEELRRRIEALVKAKTQGAKAGTPGAAGAAASAAAGVTEGAAAGALPALPELEGLEAKSIPELRLLADRFLNVDKRPKSPMNEIVEIELALDASAEEGRRELRILAAGGLSNPIAFYVGRQPEVREPGRFDPPPAGQPPPLSPPLTINGQIFPGETDTFSLSLQAGEAITCSAYARAITPYLADAVPGWFQALMYVRGPGGEEVAYVDDSGADPDPVVEFTAPRDGVYQLSIRDSIYRGRFDFVYRILVESSRAQRKAGKSAQGDRAGQGGLAAQDGRAGSSVQISQIGPVAGSGLWLSEAISAPGEVDSYRFLASAGQRLVAEIRAWRDGSPLDAALRLIDPDGKAVAFNDDAEDKAEGLLTRHADPYLMHTATMSGVYTLLVSDAEGGGSPSRRYALRFGLPVEDFAVISERSSINIPVSGSALLKLQALRKDGWTGDIEIRPGRPYPGLSLEGGIIPAGSDSARITLSWSGISPSLPLALDLEAKGKIGDTIAVRRVGAADSMMQAFASFHLVPAERLWLGFARGKSAARSLAWTAIGSSAVGGASGAAASGGSIPGGSTSAGRLQIPEGGKAELRLSIKPGLDAAPESLTISLVDPPAGIGLDGWSAAPGGLVLRFSASAGTAGIRGTLILKAGIKPETQGAKARDLGYLPALAIEVIRP